MDISQPSASGSSAKMMFQNAYVWLVLVASLDIMFTWIVLWRHGFEANGLAAMMIQTYGLPGLVLYKFLLVAFVIVLCEVVSRRNRRAGRVLVGSAIALTCTAVVWAAVLLTAQNHGLLPGGVGPTAQADGDHPVDR